MNAADPCRTPNIANGAAWQFGPVKIGGQSYEGSYFCNLFSGGVGSMDFVLGKSYRELHVTIGFADDSQSLLHVIKVELIGDDSYLVSPLTIRFGDVKPLVLDVSGITRLQIKITEQGPAGGSGPPSVPALGRPTLVRSS